MINKKIYNYELARKQGLSFKDFLKKFTKEPNPELTPETRPIFAISIIYKIQEWKNKNFKIAIVGDYDVDGITASSILHKVFDKIGLLNIVMLPDRYANGYGLSNDMINQAIVDGCHGILTVDNGINAFEAIKYAKEKGIEVIITDHHLPNDENWKECLPYVLNPHCTINGLDTKNVCGAYIALVLALKILKENELEDTDLVDEMKELATVGTIADCMPVESENQTLIDYIIKKYWIKGIIVNTGLRTLVYSFNNYKSCDLDEEYFKYYVCPCLNASGRLDKADISYFLLNKKDNKELCKLTLQILNLNVRRQNLTKDLTEYAKNKINASSKVQLIEIPENIFEGYSTKELEGVIGLVAQKLADLSGCPSLVSVNGKFSGRSVVDVNLHQLLSLCNIPSLKYGGHKEACGGNYNALEKDLFLEELEKHLNASRTSETMKFIKVPFDVNPKEIYQAVASVKPCEELPMFIMENVVGRWLKIYGQKHSSFYIEMFNSKVQCLKFNDILNFQNPKKFNLSFMFKVIKFSKDIIKFVIIRIF